MAKTLLSTLLDIGVGVLALAVGYLLGRYLHHKLPRPGSKTISPLIRPWLAVLWVWHPVFWFFPAAMWRVALDTPFVILLAMGFLTPLSLVLLFVIFSDLAAFMSRSYLPVTTLIVLVLVLMAFVDGLMFVTSYLFSGDGIKLTMFVLSTLWAPVVVIALLLLWSVHIVPCASRPAKALAMIVGYFTAFPKPVWVVEDGVFKQRVGGNPGRGIGPGYLQTEPENVVVLKKGAKLSRVAGPGVIFTDQGEAPFRVVDLRNQARSASVSALTRDGITVRAPISSLFRINRGDASIQLGEPWPYADEKAVLRTVEAQEVDPSERTLTDAQVARPWEDLPITTAVHKLRQAISFYSLDQLYQGISDPDTARSKGLQDEIALLERHQELQAALGLRQAEEVSDPLVRTTLGKLVQRAVRQALAPLGIDVHGGGIGSRIVPLHREVTEQRVTEWKSRFITKVMDWQADLQRKRVKEKDRTRQYGREAIINEMISDTYAQMSRYKSEDQKQVNHQMVAYELLNDLIRVAHDPEVQKMLPASTLPSLENLIGEVKAETDGRHET